MAKKQHIPEPSLQKSILEVRYPPKLEFFNLLFSAAQSLKGYPDWQFSNSSITLQNFENLCSLNIQHNRFAYEQDTDKNKNEKNYVEDALEKLPKILKISSCTRLGFRRKYLIPTDMSFEELVAVMNLKLLSQNERLKEIMPPETEDILYHVDFSDGNLGFHVVICPVRKSEVPRYMQFNREHHLHPSSRGEEYYKIIEAYPEVSVLLDIDIYLKKESFPMEEALELWEESRNRLKKITMDFCGYLFDKSMEG